MWLISCLLHGLLGIGKKKRSVFQYPLAFLILKKYRHDQLLKTQLKFVGMRKILVQDKYQIPENSPQNELAHIEDDDIS